MEKIEEYEKLRKIKLYGKKDVKSEEFPLSTVGIDEALSSSNR